jgi:pyridoxamine 5'-phosphate oxidase
MTFPPSTDPLETFAAWYREASEAGDPDPDAMTLATATPDGAPSARIVLFKGIEDGAFLFFTNYESRKGRELALNPRASLVFFWHKLRRQVRVEGIVEQVSAEASDAYWRTRPRGSQLSASISPQSEPVSGWAELRAAADRVELQFRDREIPRPANWGGFRVRPEAIELWIGREDRLHERYRYVRTPGGWSVTALAP